MKIDREDYIAELLFSIKEKDPIKIDVLINHFMDIDTATQRRVVFELSRADVLFAFPILVKLASTYLDIVEIVPELRQVILLKCDGVFDEEHSLLHDECITYEQFLEEINGQLIDSL